MDIEDFEFPEVEAFVRIVHGMSVDLANCVQTTIKLMMIADKYEVLEIRDKCQLFIKNGMNQENVIDILIVAESQ